MANVLKITKPDKTVHVVPTTNHAFYKAHNNRLPTDQRWKLEIVDEEEAKNLPFIDDTHVTPAEAVVKAKQLQGELSAKDAEIEALKAKLAELQSAGTGTDGQGTGGNAKATAKEVIALIDLALTVEQVESIANGDERVSVKDAAAKKIAELQPK